jgi:sulfur carrier protein ThiS adenylyltransferase
MTEPTRSTRQASILPPDKLTLPIHIIGVGAIGRQVAIQLAASGANNITIWDFDTVEVVNLGPQCYYAEDIGQPKVHATSIVMNKLNPDCVITANNSRWRRSTEVDGSAIFLCVDSMQARRDIVNNFNGRPELIIDGRMAAEVLRVVTIKPSEISKYNETLVSDDEAFEGGCTSKSTVFCSNVAAGMMISSFSKYLRSMYLDSDVTLNLLSNEIST